MEIALFCFNERKIIFLEIWVVAIDISSDEYRMGKMWLYL